MVPTRTRSPVGSVASEAHGSAGARSRALPSAAFRGHRRAGSPTLQVASQRLSFVKAMRQMVEVNPRSTRLHGFRSGQNSIVSSP